MTSNRTGISAAILAGGKSSRMGTPKGLICIEGQSMISRIAEVLKPLVDEVLVIANDDLYNHCGFPVFKDVFEEKGPVSGIHSALIHAQNDTVVILSCDVPFVSSGLIEFLLVHKNEAEIIVPVHQGKTEPLIGVYGKSTLPSIEQCIVSGQTKMQEILVSLQAKHIQLPDNLFSESLFININTPEDLVNAFPQSMTL